MMETIQKKTKEGSHQGFFEESEMTSTLEMGILDAGGTQVGHGTKPPYS